MKKIIATILTIAMLLTGAAMAEAATQTEAALELGSVTVYDFGDIRLHAYNANDELGDECYLIESDEGLVILETGAFTENLVEWKGYIDSLNKPLAGALLAYHPNGYEIFGDVTIYATENALANWQPGGSINVLTDDFVARYGDVVAASHPAEAEIVNFGDTVTIAGMDFIIRDEGDDAYGVEIPAINTVYIHMLGSDCHNILTSREHIAAFAEELKGFDYDLVLTSHYIPEGEDAPATKVAYLEKALELAESCADAAEFVTAMNEAFPDYSGANYLEMTAGMLFQ
ncbi:MAG: hypothetical protein ACI4MF_14150 [Candidatus Faecivicinus sp.]